VNDRAGLRRFLETRASYMAQTSLYGYLRTRAGMIYPQLFDNDEFVLSRSTSPSGISGWPACRTCRFTPGGLLARQSRAPAPEVGALMQGAGGGNPRADTGTPADAGGDFRRTPRACGRGWRTATGTRIADDETPFSESPAALIRWAPIVENLKELDEEIVRNSVRFRWQEIRRDLRRNLDAEAVLGSIQPGTPIKTA
jgi:hypothetical protein